MAALTQPKQDRWLCAHPRWDERAKAGTQRKNMATAKKCKTHSESCLPLFYVYGIVRSSVVKESL